MEVIIDPQTSPVSSAEEIAAEMEAIRRLPACPGRDATLDEMQMWLDEKASAA